MTKRSLPQIVMSGITAFPGSASVTKALPNNRTCNLRVAMKPAQEAMGKMRPGDKYLTIAYPAINAVLIIREPEE